MIENEVVQWETFGGGSVIKISGKEPYLKHKEVERARHHYGPGGYDVIEIDAEVSGGEDVLSEILQNPSSIFIRGHRLIIVHNANALKPPKVLQRYCEQSPGAGDDILVLVSRSKGRVAKWYKELPHTYEYVAPEIPEWKAAQWLRKEAGARDLTLSKSLADIIVLNVGSNLFDLADELDKIALYKEGQNLDSVVTPSDIQAVLYARAAPSLFEIVRLWGEGRIQAALQYYQSHFERTPVSEQMGSVLILLVHLLDRVNNLLRARSLKASGVTGETQIAKELGVSPWIYRNNVAPQVAYRNEVQLKKAYLALCEIERKVKTGKASGYLLVQHFLVTH